MSQAKIDFDFGSCIGTVGFVSVKEIQGGKDQYGNTHRASFTIKGVNKSGDPKKEKDSIFFAAGSIKGDKLTAKDTNGNWVDVTAGAEIKFQFVQNGEWYNVKRSQITVQKVGQQSGGKEDASGGNSGKTFDKTGIKVGHLQNCTENYLGVDAFASPETYEQVAKSFDDMTKRVAESVKAANPNASAFDIDVTAGRAVLSASRNAGTDDLAAIEQYAMNGASNAVRDVAMSIVKGKSPEKQQAPQQKTPAQPKVNPQEPTIDFDDDIPF